MRRGDWFIFGEVAVSPSRYGTILVDSKEFDRVKSRHWHVRAGKHLYVRTWIDSHRESKHRGESIYLHDFLFHHKEFEVIDFKNGNGLDCRSANIRITDKSNDCCNRKITTSNTGYLGVHYSASRRKFVAQISYRGRWKYIGRFDSLADAIEARDDAAQSLHGEFASLNSSGQIVSSRGTIPADE